MQQKKGFSFDKYANDKDIVMDDILFDFLRKQLGKTLPYIKDFAESYMRVFAEAEDDGDLLIFRGRNKDVTIAMADDVMGLSELSSNVFSMPLSAYELDRKELAESYKAPALSKENMMLIADVFDDFLNRVDENMTFFDVNDACTWGSFIDNVSKYQSSICKLEMLECADYILDVRRRYNAIDLSRAGTDLVVNIEGAEFEKTPNDLYELFSGQENNAAFLEMREYSDMHMSSHKDLQDRYKKRGLATAITMAAREHFILPIYTNVNKTDDMLEKSLAVYAEDFSSLGDESKKALLGLTRYHGKKLLAEHKKISIGRGLNEEIANFRTYAKTEELFAKSAERLGAFLEYENMVYDAYETFLERKELDEAVCAVKDKFFSGNADFNIKAFQSSRE